MAQQSGRIQVFESLTPRQQRSTLVGILVFVAVVMSIINALANGEADWSGLTDNFSTELLGAALTFYIFDLFQERRDDLRLKLRLVDEMHRADNATALKAVRELGASGWLSDGSLRSVYLWGANLQGAILVYAHLQDAYFVNANLEGANFGKANLNGADFEGANLQRAVFSHPLVGAAELNETTTLPDGSNYNPEQGLEQLERFTNPEHQDFWRSDDPDSPAYRGNEEDDE